MRVAVLGAGLSGLCCAIELERRGIRAELFEQRTQAGGRFPNGEAMLPILFRPLPDTLTLLGRMGVNLLPAARLRRMVLHTHRRRLVLAGDLGYITRRGDVDGAFEKQLAVQVRSPVHYNAEPDWRDLSRSYDVLVVANGRDSVPSQMGLWQTDVAVCLRGCLIRGQFDPEETNIWVDTAMALTGYVFLIPLSPETASIVNAVPTEDPAVAERLWQTVQERLGVRPEPHSSFTVDRFMIGRPRTRQVGNIYLVGQAGGFVEPAGGFGQFGSMMSGLLAGRAIATGEDFNRLTAWWDRLYEERLALRRYIDTLDNAAFDRGALLLSLPGLRTLAVRTRLNVVRSAALIARLRMGLRGGYRGSRAPQ